MKLYGDKFFLTTGKALFPLLLFAASLLFLIIAIMPDGVFWTSDGGNKFIQTENFLRNTSLAIEYPSAALDKTASFFPESGHHFIRKGDSFYSFYPPFLSVLSVPFYKIFGFKGLFLIPASASILALFLVWKIGERTFRSTRFYAAAAFFFCTPFLFYSVNFWEHSLSCAAAAFALLLLVKGRASSTGSLVAAGLLCTVSALFREEGFIFAVALGVGLLFIRLPFRMLAVFAVSFCCGATAILVFNYFFSGHLSGFHGAVYSGLEGRGFSFNSLLMNFYYYLFATRQGFWVNLFSALPFIAALFLGLLTRYRQLSLIKLLIMIAVLLSAVFFCKYLFDSRTPVFDSLWSQSFMGACPFLVLSGLGLRGFLSDSSFRIRFLAAALLVYLILTLSLLNMSDLGIIWGGRHFINILPAAVPLCFIAAQRIWTSFSLPALRSSWLSLVFCLVIASAAIQISGVRTLFVKLAASSELLKAASALEDEIIVTDIYWLPEELASLYFHKNFLYVKSDADLMKLEQLLRSSSKQSFTLVLSRKYRQLSNQAIAAFSQKTDIRPGKLLSPEGAAFLEVQFFTCRLRPSVPSYLRPRN